MPRKHTCLTPFPKQGIPTTEFRNFVSEVENLFLEEQIKLKTPDKDDFELWHSLHQLWVLHWFVKETWCSNHKIPYLKKKTKFGYRKLGILYKSVKAVIEDLCTREFGYSDMYNHQPGKWLIEVMKESRLEGYTRLHCAKFKTKTAELRSLNQERAKLRKYVNPIEPELFPHTWRFVESALDSAEHINLDIFRREKWNPFQHNLNAAIEEMKKPCWVHMAYEAGSADKNIPNLVLSPTKSQKQPIEIEKYMKQYTNFY